MNKQCEIVRDLLPLYIDSACSESSARLVEAHLPQCPECSRIRRELELSELDATVKREKDSVIAHHKKTQKRKAFVAGACIAGVLCIPVIACLIVNLALGHALDWFFIVLTALAVFASLIVVPLIAESKKGVYTLLSFTVSLLLLLFTCAVYTGGRWFPVAGSSVLFGLSVVFSPYLAYALPLTGFFKKNKGLLSLSVDTLLFFIMMVCIGFYTGSELYRRSAPPIALYNLGFVWLVFIICRYFGVGKLVRAGITCIISGVYLFSLDKVINYMLGENIAWPEANLLLWNADTVDGNIKWTLLIVGAVVGLLLFVIAAVKKIKSAGAQYNK